MPMLIGSTTAACTLLCIITGQIALGVEALGVLIGAGVLMSLRRD